MLPPLLLPRQRSVAQLTLLLGLCLGPDFGLGPLGADAVSCTRARSPSDTVWKWKKLPGLRYEESALAGLPAGPWTRLARGVTLKGSKLCADLRRLDSSWSRDCIVVRAAPAFENDAGEMISVEVAQTFANVDGKFKLQVPAGLPGGTWQSSAKKVKLEDELLCAELRRLDGSYASPSCVAFDGVQAFQNDDGQFKLKLC